MAFGRFDVKGDDHDVQPAPPISIPPPSARAKNVAFVEGDISKAVPDGSFDAAVGRCVLFFVADPAAALRRIVATVRPGGNVAFHEPGNATLRPDARPPSPILHRAWDWIIGGFEGAGLPAPTMRLDAAVGGVPDWPGYDYIAETLRTILPLIARHGVATEDRSGSMISVLDCARKLSGTAASSRPGASSPREPAGRKQKEIPGTAPHLTPTTLLLVPL